MELTIKAGTLADALTMVRGIILTRTTIPILTHVKLVASGDRAAISANNLEMQVALNVDCICQKTGDVTVPGLPLLALVKSFAKNADVALKMKDGQLSISCGRSRYSLPTLPAGDFPEIPTLEDGAAVFTLPASTLAEALTATRGTVSTETTRFYLCGVAVNVESNGLDFVSTDGHRLSRLKQGCPGGAEGLQTTIVPTDAVVQILALCESGGDAKVSVTQNRISVQIEDTLFVSKLIAGTYPDYLRVIPQKKNRSFTINSDELGEAINRLLTVSTKAEPVAVFKTNGTAVDIRLSRTAGEQGSETVDAEISTASEFGVNARYVADMIRLWPADTSLEFQSNDPGDPILVTSKDVPGQTHVIMPMRG